MARYILITGIGRGLGAALAQRFLQEKDIIVIGTSRNETPPFEHPRLHLVHDDIARHDNGFSTILQTLGEHKFTAVINNAAVLQNKLFGTYTAEELEQQFRVNVFAPFMLLQAIAGRMAKGSHVVNIGSMGGYQGSVKFPGLSAYSATKGALAVLTECLAEEWKDIHVCVNCLALGSVNTEMLAEAFPGYVSPVNPHEIADYIAKFALEGHQFFNGKVLPVSITIP